MTGRILIIDPVSTNRIVLRVKLATAYYEVVQAASAAAALRELGPARPDLVIASAGLPDMDGPAFCTALRAHPLGEKLPLIVVQAEPEAAERLACLAAGADDVIARPIDDLVLLARLRALLRARDAEAELELREDTRRALGLRDGPGDFAGRARIMLVPAPGSLMPDSLPAELGRALSHKIETTAHDDALRDRDPPPDVIVLIESARSPGEALRLLPQLRSRTALRHAAIVYVAHAHHRAEAAAALDMGASDLVTCGPDAAELALRIRKQARRKQAADRLRANMRDGLRAAVIDPLTGLYNRRYAIPYLTRLGERTDTNVRPFAALLLDVDHFKRINDTFGHFAGDAVLVALGERLRQALTGSDLVARIGGEEFLVVLPDADAEAALEMAERLRRLIAVRPVAIPGEGAVPVTLSIGVAIGTPGRGDSAESLLEAADTALYAAKARGRNRVVTVDMLTPLPGPEPRSAPFGTEPLPFPGGDRAAKVLRR